MNITQSYHDLLKEIEIIELRLEDLKSEQRKLRRILDAPDTPSAMIASYGKERVQSSPYWMTLLHVEERYEEISKLIRPLEDTFSRKLLTKRQIEEKLNEFEGLEYKIIYAYEMQGKPLYQVADELGYSYDWIRQVYSRTKKAQRTHRNY